MAYRPCQLCPAGTVAGCVRCRAHDQHLHLRVVDRTGRLLAHEPLCRTCLARAGVDLPAPDAGPSDGVETSMRGRVEAAVRRLTVEAGFPPTVREVGDAVGLRSTSSVWAHLRRLRDEGRVCWTPGAARTLTVVDRDGIRGSG